MTAHNEIAELLNNREGFVSLSDYLTDTKGIVCQSSQLEDAMADATAKKKVLLLSPYQILLTRKVLISAHLIGTSWPLNSKYARTVFISGMSGGEPCLEMLDVDGFHLENFAIQDGIGQESTLLKIGDIGTIPVEGAACSRGYLNNIVLYGGKTGLNMQGWQNSIGNIFIKRCGLGLLADECNSVNIDSLNIEECEKPFDIDGFSGVSIDRLILQGHVGNTPAEIDNSTGVSIQTLWCEGKRTEPWMKVGFSGRVRSLNVTTGFCDDVGPGVDPIQFDDAIDCDVAPFFKTGSASTSISVTKNTKQESTKIPNLLAGWAKTKVADKFVFPAENYFQNPNFNGNRWGSSNVIIGGGVRAILSEEKTNTRTGGSALRITCTPGASGSYMTIVEDAQNVIFALQNKNVTFAAWVYVPNISTYDVGNDQTMFPSIQIATVSYNTVRQAFPSESKYHVVGNWVFMYVECELTAPFTSINYTFSANASGNVSNDGEYIIVDSAWCCHGHVHSQIYAGNVRDSDNNPFRSVGGNCLIKNTMEHFSVMKDDPEQIWKTGDELKYTDAEDSPGEYCISGGIGSNAVWKRIANFI